MTARARLTEADMRRACRAVASAGFSCARIIMDFHNQRIEVVIGEPETSAASSLLDEWPDDDV